jgi:hypothetical protein
VEKVRGIVRRLHASPQLQEVFINSQARVNDQRKAEGKDELVIGVIPADVVTRWGSTHKMCKAFLLNWPAVELTLATHEYLLKKDQGERRPTGEELAQLQEMVIGLAPYISAMDELQGEKYVTISSVVPTWAMFESWADDLAAGLGVSKDLGHALTVQMDSAWSGARPANVAMCLDPRYKDLAFLGNDADGKKAREEYWGVFAEEYAVTAKWVAEQKQSSAMDTKSDSKSSSSSNAAGAVAAGPAPEVKAGAAPEVKADGAADAKRSSSSSANSVALPENRKRSADGDVVEVEQPQQKKAKPDGAPRTTEALALMLRKQRGEQPKAEADELTRWRQLKPIDDVTVSPLQWFAVNAADWPIISVMAEKFLAVPASSAPCERLFSDAGNLFTTKRARISDEHAEQQLFLHENWPLLQQFIQAHRNKHEMDTDAKSSSNSSKAATTEDMLL